MKFSPFEVIEEFGLPAPRGILQVGASYGQEMSEFRQRGVAFGVFIEPLPEPFAHLAALCRQIPNYVAVQTLCTDVAGQSNRFHVASNGGMSSSILKPANHLTVNDYVSFPTTIDAVSSTVDDVMQLLAKSGHGHILPNLDILYMDCQGAEFKIILGAQSTLRTIKYIYMEVMRADLYEGQVPFLTYCTYLDAIGFTLNNMYFGPLHAGDALFIRKDVLGLS
jgi:FkbM family methyltransferase